MVLCAIHSASELHLPAGLSRRFCVAFSKKQKQKKQNQKNKKLNEKLNQQTSERYYICNARKFAH